jgi:hypothetical protein
MQGFMKKAIKKSAPRQFYVSPMQLPLDCFKTTFEQQLDPKNRWVVLAHLVPWDEVCNIYLREVGVSETGRPSLNPRIILGSIIIKHLGNLDDRETVDQIRENIYMQYFLGYSSFSSVAPFHATLFVEFRKRLGMDTLNAITEKIAALKTHMETKADEKKSPTDLNPTSDPEPPSDLNPPSDLEPTSDKNSDPPEPEPKGRVIFDATACPQDIAYPTDLNLLSDARKKSQELIDELYDPELHPKKPRTYRKIARKLYLKTAQKKNKSRKEIRKAVGAQLRFLNRNLNSIDGLLDAYPVIPLKPKEYKYLLVIHTLYDQQAQMYDTQTHRIEDRIVSIHQPHVRPIVRGNSQANVEFGAKIHLSLIDGISFLDELSWNAFNEGSHMMDYVEKYHQRFGFYPRELLADKIYCTRDNRAALKKKGINLLAKPLGRPSAVQNHVSPGERNPIEGKFGQAKTAYGLDRIRARLQGTSESWIASIILVLNLVKLAGVALPCYILNRVVTFSARLMAGLMVGSSARTKPISISRFAEDYCRQITFRSQISKSTRLIPEIAA